MTTTLDRLLPLALIGSERAPGLRVALREAPAPLAGLMGALAAAPDDDATVLLRAAGVLATAERVGTGAREAGTLAESSPPARPDARPALSGAQGRALLQRLLGVLPLGLRHAALRGLAARGWRLPAVLLVPMLDLALREAALRPAVGALIGERGAWLVRQQPRWRSVGERPVQPTLDDWAHGSTATRLAFLRHERHHDAAAARTRLEAELGQLAAPERAELLGALAVGLSLDDEPLLARLLQRDRGSEVRAQAARLLQRLPGSAQVAWLVGQWDTLLRAESTWLGLKQRWHIEPPVAEDAAWKAHGIELQRPRHDALGERGWWLCQLVRLTPLAFWTGRTGLSPADLIAWARGTDWKEALLRGWREAAQALPESADALGAGEVDWLIALLAGREAAGGSPVEQAALRHRLPLSARTALWRDRLAAHPVEVADEIVQTCTQALREGHDPSDRLLDPVFAAELMRVLEAQWSALLAGRLDERRSSAWLATAPELLAWLPLPAWSMVEALPPPAAPIDATATWLQQRRVALHDRLQQIVALRRAFEALPAAPSPSSCSGTSGTD
jgi:hypothetical protein